jgi:hypothetical protein
MDKNIVLDAVDRQPLTHLKHREIKIPITAKGRYKIYIRFDVDVKKMKIFIRNAFLSSGKKESQLKIDVPSIEEFNAVGCIPEISIFSGTIFKIPVGKKKNG